VKATTIAIKMNNNAAKFYWQLLPQLLLQVDKTMSLTLRQVYPLLRSDHNQGCREKDRRSTKHGIV